MRKKVLSIACMMAVLVSLAGTGIQPAHAATHKHSYKETVVRAVQCDVNGKARYTCSCGDEYTKSIPMTGHSYSEVVLKQATCSSYGIVEKTCTICGSHFTGRIPKSAHDYVKSGNQQVCRMCGRTESISSTQTESKPVETKPSTTQKPATDTVKMSANEKARKGAVDWAIKIANDNSFHYGRSSWAHHNGCYFCGTNQKSGSIKRKAGASVKACEKTYCCNPFVTAAFKHGAGAPEVDCKVSGKRINLANDKNPALNNKKAFKKISKPKKVTSLEAGDVLLTPTHAMLYAGNGKVVEAAHHDNGKKDSYWNDSIRHKTLSSSQWKRVTKIYRYIGKGKY